MALRVPQLGRLPWPIAVLVIFGLSRVVSTAVLLATARQQPESPWGPAGPDYLGFVNRWDAQWYERIAEHGYPDSIPRSSSGAVQENAWAFSPLFPLFAKGIMSLTGEGWATSAAAAALICGALASAAMFLLFRRLVGQQAGLWATAIVLFSPLGALFQLPYAESLHVALLALTLLLLIERQFILAIPLIVLTGLARPAGPPLAIAVIFTALYWAAPRRRGMLSSHEFLSLLGAVVASLAGALAWPVIAWMRTGSPTAYTDTETVWRGGDLTLFAGWMKRAEFLFGPFSTVALVMAGLLLLAIFLSRPVRSLGPVVWGWCAAYALYLAAVLDPQTSTFRLLLPLFPLAALLAVGWRAVSGGGSWRSSGRPAPEQGTDLLALRVLALLGGVALQAVWVYWLWRWTPLPGGGDYPP